MLKSEPQYKTPSKFDVLLGELRARKHDVTETRATTVRHHSPVIGAVQTFIVQTFRDREAGDWVFLEYVDDQGSVRIPIPPPACDAIARQRDALSTKNRRLAGKQQAQARKAMGEVPAFLRKKKTKRKPKTAEAAIHEMNTKLKGRRIVISPDPAHETHLEDKGGSHATP